MSPTGPDTVAAGLRSEETLALDDSPRVRFLLAPLPGTDTAATLDTERGGVVLLHTVERAGGRVTSALARNDGMVGTATVALVDSGRLGAYDATWADTANALQTRRVTVRGDSRLVLERTGRPDTSFAAPATGTAWGVADYAMNELLAPALLALPRDGVARPFAVLRPFPGHWDAGTAAARECAGLVLVVLRFDRKSRRRRSSS